MALIFLNLNNEIMMMVSALITWKHKVELESWRLGVCRSPLYQILIKNTCVHNNLITYWTWCSDVVVHNHDDNISSLL